MARNFYLVIEIVDPHKAGSPSGDYSTWETWDGGPCFSILGRSVNGHYEILIWHETANGLLEALANEFDFDDDTIFEIVRQNAWVASELVNEQER